MNPFSALMEIVAGELVAPSATDTDEGETEIEKSGEGGGGGATNALLPPPPHP